MRVRYIGCSDAQAKWGGCDDPREQLVAGEVYLVEDKEVHRWHTRYIIDGQGYNSVCFEEIPEVMP